MSPGSSLNYAGAFLAGLLASFTPCVYPLIPIVVGYIGARSSKSAWQGFRLSLGYCLGISLTYTTLGVFAALSGRLFGQVSVNPTVNILVGALFIFFGLSVLDVFNLAAFIPFTTRPINWKPTGFSAFMLGATSGFVVSPCTAPVMASILVYISTRKNILFGASLMLAFSVGMSILFLFLGTFSSLINKLPKSAAWNEMVKKILGLVLIGMGCYFIFLAGRRWI